MIHFNQEISGATDLRFSFNNNKTLTDSQTWCKMKIHYMADSAGKEQKDALRTS